MLNSPQNGRPTCTYNHPHHLHQKFVPLLQLQFLPPNFTPYFFTKPFLQLPPTLLTSITQQFLHLALFLHSAILTICFKSFLHISAIYPIQVSSRNQWARKPCKNWHCFNFFLLLRSMDRDNSANNCWFPITQSQKIGVLQVVLSEEDA